MFVFTKEMADILLRIRVKANLTQREVASSDKRWMMDDLEENLAWKKYYLKVIYLTNGRPLWIPKEI